MAVFLLAIYLLVPSVLGLKEQKRLAKKEGHELPWYAELLSDKELNLGLDLRGGLYLEMNVGTDDALKHQVDFMASDVERLAEGEDIKGTKASQIAGLKIRVTTDAEKIDALTSRLIDYYGNQIITIDRDPQELYLEYKGDGEMVRKQAYSLLESIQDFNGELQMVGNSTIAISAADPEQQALLPNLFAEKDAWQIREQSLEGVFYVSLSEAYVKKLTKDIIEQAAKSVRNRINRYGVAESSVSRQSSDRLVVELPGVKEPQAVIDLIRRTGKLEFRIVDERLGTAELNALVNDKASELKLENVYDAESVNLINDALKAELPDQSEVAFRYTRDDRTGKILRASPFLLEKRAEVTGDMLDNASVQVQNNLPYVSMAFNKAGAKKFGDLTKDNVGKALAIVLDGVVMSAPNIRSAIYGGQAQIELGYGRYEDLHKEASDLVLILKEGALPASLSVATQNLIGPTLGQESIDAGIRSLIIAAGGVLLFMLFYYRVGGLISNLALLFNVLLVFAGLTLFQASLTLPGMAGIVLTLGMAVDANVIIFERMREERHMGHDAASIVESGYGNALSAILDSNITTFISGLVLFEFGTGPIKGFATTLMLGILTTLFTAVLFTRFCYDGLLHGVKIKKIWI